MKTARDGCSHLYDYHFDADGGRGGFREGEDAAATGKIARGRLIFS
jgi:hypothetical protein